jgi:hypothetical protein
MYFRLIHLFNIYSYLSLPICGQVFLIRMFIKILPIDMSMKFLRVRKYSVTKLKWGNPILNTEGSVKHSMLGVPKCRLQKRSHEMCV